MSDPYDAISEGIGCSFEKFPHAYWKKFVHGSAALSIHRSSSPGGSVAVGASAAVLAARARARTPGRKETTNITPTAINPILVFIALPNLSDLPNPTRIPRHHRLARLATER